MSERYEFMRDYLDDEISRFLIYETDSYWAEDDSVMMVGGMLDVAALAKLILKLGFILPDRNGDAP